MIPKDWQFKGWVNVGVAEGGCFGLVLSCWGRHCRVFLVEAVELYLCC